MPQPGSNNQFGQVYNGGLMDPIGQEQQWAVRVMDPIGLSTGWLVAHLLPCFSVLNSHPSLWVSDPFDPYEGMDTLWTLREPGGRIPGPCREGPSHCKMHSHRPDPTPWASPGRCLWDSQALLPCICVKAPGYCEEGSSASIVINKTKTKQPSIHASRIWRASYHQMNEIMPTKKFHSMLSDHLYYQHMIKCCIVTLSV